jgi:hypothetical protein
MTTLHPEAQVVVPENPWNDSRVNLPKWGRKVKAPFRVTRMSSCPKHPVLWLWSRRGRNWTVDQELPSDPQRNCP